MVLHFGKGLEFPRIGQDLVACLRTSALLEDKVEELDRGQGQGVAQS